MTSRARTDRSLRSRMPAERALYQRIKQMFASQNLDGFILDAADISTLNQVSTGTTPVTAVTQPIGWFGDKHLGMQLGPELVTNGGFDTSAGWSVPIAGASITGGRLVFDGVTSIAGGVKITGRSETNAVVGKTYSCTFTITEGTTRNISLFFGNVLCSPNNSAGTYTTYIVATATTGIEVYSRTEAGVRTGSIDNISVKLLDGNHAIQATAAARPTWQVDANGYHYAQLLGTDDSLSCATGGGGSTGFLFCAAITHAAGGVINTLFSDVGTNTGYEIEISALDKLTFTAGNGTLITTLTSTASITVGITTYITVWDDGVNLNLQIDGGTVESTARPVVSAGTAGYTLFKDNAVALHHFVGNFYRGTYIKNWSGTAAQLAAIQSWVKAGAGL